jgi:hypothetical protein
MKKAQIILMVCAFLFSKEGKAQTVLFNNAYDFEQLGNFAFDVLLPDDSTYLTLSGSYNYYTAEICPTLSWFAFNGIVDSQKSFFKPDYQVYIGEPGSFHADRTGGYFFGGSTNYLFDTIYYQSYGLLVRYDVNGDTLYTRTYGDSSKWQAFYGSSQTHDSGYVMIGVQADTVNYAGDFYLVRTDKNGNLLWQQTFGGVEDDLGFRVYEQANRALIMAGCKEYANNLYQPWIIVSDSSGNEISNLIFSGAYKCGCARITPTFDQGFLLWGCLDTTIEFGDYPYPVHVSKLDSNLHVEWRTIYDYPQEKDIWQVNQISDSGYVLVGEAINDSSLNENGWIARVDKNGNKQWEHFYQYGNSFFNEFRDAQQTYDGGYIVCGGTLNDQNNQDIWLVKLDSNGCLVPGCVINTGTIETSGSELQLEIFPNPAAAQTHIVYHLPPATKQASLKMFDVSGKEILSLVLQKNEQAITIDLSHYAEGMYLLRLIANNKTFITKKLLKQ